jgi:hypothetical protein
MIATLPSLHVLLVTLAGWVNRHQPHVIGRILTPIVEDRADLVLGVRHSAGPGAAPPLHAVLGTRAGAWVLQCRYGVRLHELGPFRAIRRDAWLAVGLQEMTDGGPVAMVARAARAGLRVQAVDVTQRRRHGGTSEVAGTVTGSLRAAWRFVRVAWPRG